MDSSESASPSSYTPPPSVKGMTTLDKEAFSTTVKIPGFVLAKKDINKFQKLWKAQLLRRRGIKPIAELASSDPQRDTHSLILLDPDSLEKNPLTDEAKEKLGFGQGDLEKYSVTLTYENWSPAEIMRAVLPSGAENVTSFTQVGHIAHFNLREESLPFKNLIGEVILDKIPSVKTVVNKLNTIDNTFRNFQMELLAGDKNYITELREHGCTFELDFSKVYWNSRLSTEHSRIVATTDKDSLVFDVFAGIGPFAVPLAKKKRCTVHANDLNPSSYEFLQKNFQKNKISTDRFKTYNLDGRDFIRNVVKETLLKLPRGDCDSKHQKDSPLQTSYVTKDISPESERVNNGATSKDTVLPSQEDILKTVVIMNLPGLAIDFLDAFNSLFKDTLLDKSQSLPSMELLPTVHCYTFEQKSDEMEDAVRKRAEAALGIPFPASQNVSIIWVRNVAPTKEMLCLSFKLWPELLLGHSHASDHRIHEGVEPDQKRQKLSS